ncbi:MAG: helix-turn-helix transcriptional regulator [Paracoccus sp. (in: a-proteobacteria)]|uniref:helix-turn-helix domain-containing protein n=1 Tax=Paracoccus sp. TaxID=267 RepID=UPI0030018BF1
MSAKELFEAENDAEREEDAIQSLLLSIKISLQRAMQENGVNKKTLSERLGVTPARVSQLLGDNNANITIKTLGKICHALGEDFEFVRHSEYRCLSRELRFELVKETIPSIRQVKWQDETANSRVRTR